VTADGSRAAGRSSEPAAAGRPARAPAVLGALPRVVVKAGRVRPLWAGHPWVFAQAVERLDASLEPGAEVVVTDPRGNTLGRGLCSPSSAIAVRLLAGLVDQPLDAAFFAGRIERAAALRRAAGLPDQRPGQQTTGYRLIHGEGDGLPGLIVDVYDDVAAIQLGTIGLAQRRAQILEALVETIGPRAVIDRTPAALAQLEGQAPPEPPPAPAEDPLEAAQRRICYGDAALQQLVFSERGLRFELPLSLGQKTGFYFDQRPLRARIEALAAGSRVLDACCYVGPIALAAARGGAAHIEGVDKSREAVAVAQRCARLNGFEQVHFAVADATQAMADAAATGGADIVICDPPKLATRGTASRALKAYTKLATAACHATKPGGLLAFCSCSAAVSQPVLQRALAVGARAADRRATVLERLSQGPDHPVPAAFPEGLYLDVLLCRVA